VYHAIEHLCNELEGVATPVASAILAIVYYPMVPVLDRNAYYALYGTYDFDRYNAQVYVDYYELVSRLAEQEDLTPKAMDEKLMEMGKKEQRYARA
jgi:adenine-specific DNA glycosylase